MQGLLPYRQQQVRYPYNNPREYQRIKAEAEEKAEAEAEKAQVQTTPPEATIPNTGQGANNQGK